ncbi:F-box and WD-40 domain protein 10 [Clonorchis sinensis]|uniref:F-box and WD-40 domain protein 10 n=1 Tax=Clonorchis sinensis TaxID=79923 RepID=H2KSG9_CLOSI|nr:F-box and WD-40 domain protein 10 [Clonorchis sinensis]
MLSRKRRHTLHSILEGLKGSVIVEKIPTARVRSKQISHESAQDAQLDSKPIVFHPVENFARFLLVPIPSSCVPNIQSKGRKAAARRKDRSYASVSESESSKNTVRPKTEVQPTTSERNRSRSIAAQRPVQISLKRLAPAMRKAFSGLPLTYVPLEERNVYTNPYSVFVLYERQADERLFPNRVIHTDDTQQWLAHCEGTVEHRRIHFLNIAPREHDGNCDIPEATDFLEHLNRTWLTGHAGSVRTLWLDSLRGFLISGSYDTTIRLWDLSENIVHLQRPEPKKQEADSSEQKAEDPMSFHTGQSRCVCKYRGHSANVLCLWVDQSRVWPRVQPPKKRQHQRAGEADAVPAFLENLTFRFASGGADNTCYVWQVDSRVPLWMMKHWTSVTAVVLCGYWCASGDQSGEIKLWDLRDDSPLLHKVLQGHTDEITALRMNEAYLVSSSKDGFVRVWDLVSKLTTCLGQLAHLSPVLCMELRFLRILTGCADGRVRVWNLLTQNCQRVFLGNNRHDPVLSLLAFDNRIILNTQHNILDLQFNKSVWSFSQSRDAVAEVPWTGPTLPRAEESPNERPMSRAEIRYNGKGISKVINLRITEENEHSFTSGGLRKPKIIMRGNSGQRLQSLSSPRATHASNCESRSGNCRSKSS